MDARAAESLGTVLDRELEAADRLLAALEAERALLIGPDPAALESATATKERLVREFEQLAAERRAVMTQLGHGVDREAMIRLLRAVEDPAYTDESPRAGPLAARWRRLLDRLTKLRDANERNGLIIGLRSRQVRQALNVLRTGRPDELTYGRAGAAANRSATRALGRA